MRKFWMIYILKYIPTDLKKQNPFFKFCVLMCGKLSLEHSELINCVRYRVKYKKRWQREDYFIRWNKNIIFPLDIRKRISKCAAKFLDHSLDTVFQFKLKNTVLHIHKDWNSFNNAFYHYTFGLACGIKDNFSHAEPGPAGGVPSFGGLSNGS